MREEQNDLINMERQKTTEARPRQVRSASIDVSYLFYRRSSKKRQMLQSGAGFSSSSEQISKLLKRLRNKSVVTEPSIARRNTISIEKRATSSFENRDHRPSYNFSSTHQSNRGHHKDEPWDMKTNLPKRWLKEYEKKQVDLCKAKQKKLQPLERFKRAVKLIQTCNAAFKSVVYYAVQRGQHNEVTSDATLSLKSAEAKGTVEDLMFDPEFYKTHHEFLMPRWAKEITNKDPESRTPQEVHSIVQIMKQLKGFRRYCFKTQEALCKAIRYDCFGRRRVVIRKGQVAMRFYFIFSGSVCVTVDDDEHSAFAKPTENSVLKRGDYFGELAFIRNLKRAATVVCLEKTELLSVDKEDFFSARIDECFKADAQRRTEFFKEHQVFSTWPEDIINKVAVESRLQDYNSDEVIVRDSSDFHWIVFIIKGQCDVLRLLDLSKCKNYIKHAIKYRTDKILDDASSTYRLNTEEVSLSSIVTRGFPFILESSETKSTKGSDKTMPHAQTKPKSAESSKRVHQTKEKSPRCQDNQVSIKGILQPDCFKRNPMKCHVSFDDEGSQEQNASLRWAMAYNDLFVDKETEKDVDEGLVEERTGDNVGVGVFMAVDRLRPGQCFGAWSLLEQEENCLPSSKADESNSKVKRHPPKENKPRERKFILVSGGCEIIKVAKDVFFKYLDDSTLEKLKMLTTNYPRDSTLCQAYLQQSDWRTYREEIVDNVVARHIVRQETAKGFLRSPTVRSSPVPSPLCSVKVWSRSPSKWEYFTDAGWVSGQVTRPLIEARHSRSSSASKSTTKSNEKSSMAREHSARAGVMPSGSSGITRRSFRTPRGSSGTFRQSPLTLPPTSALKSPEKLLPLVRNDLVLAQGSQRALVLTQGGSRCNDYQLHIERKIINKHDVNKTFPHLGKVT